MNRLEQIRENEKYFENVLRLVKNGGFYLFPSCQETYKVIDGKFYPVTTEGYNRMKEITSKEWCEKYVSIVHR